MGSELKPHMTTCSKLQAQVAVDGRQRHGLGAPGAQAMPLIREHAAVLR